MSKLINLLETFSEATFLSNTFGCCLNNNGTGINCMTIHCCDCIFSLDPVGSLQIAPRLEELTNDYKDSKCNRSCE